MAAREGARAASSTGALRPHGGVTDAESAALGVEGEILDCSASLNPFGPHPAITLAVREAVLDRYPDPAATAARRALARTCRVGAERIVLGNGAAELLWTIARVVVQPGTHVLVPEPTFVEFRAAALASGGSVVTVHGPDAVTPPDLDTIEMAMRARPISVVYLCAPNNPTGDAVRAAAIAAAAERHPRATVVVDEAFLSLSEHAADLRVALPENVIRVRSLTKEHAVPGIRVGYALASERLATRLEEARAAWTTNAMAHAAAVATAGLSAFVTRSRQRLLAERNRFVDALKAAGLAPRPSSTFYFVVPVGDAAALRTRLLQRHRIAVRDCTSFGMPDHVRLATRTAAENARVVAALAAELGR